MANRVFPQISSDSSPRTSTSRRLGRVVNGVLAGGLLAAIVSQARVARAHGAIIQAAQTAVEIQASFDDGKPMADAQVLIYSPSNLETPWQKGQTDATGKFLFAPDAETPGDWEVTVRKAGHGGTTTFVVNSEGNAASSGSSAIEAASPVQKWTSMAAVVWGFVGTALFFSRKTSANRASDRDLLEKLSPEQMTTKPAADPVSAVSRSSGGQH